MKRGSKEGATAGKSFDCYGLEGIWLSVTKRIFAR